MISSPSIILVKPQLAENIGMVGRAMLNCGLTDLRLVKPREDHLGKKGIRACAGADDVMRSAQIFPTVAKAVADFNTVYAATARSRDIVKPVLGPKDCMAATIKAHARQEKVAFMFGREKSGLTNVDLSYADAIVTIPVNPAFSSLNLAQSVMVLAYEWFQHTPQADSFEIPDGTNAPKARKKDLLAFLGLLEKNLAERGFFDSVPDKRPKMVQNIRHLFQRLSLSHAEILTLHGIIKTLQKRKKNDKSV